MEPFYFGRDSSLFGMYHMAEGIPRKHGILIAGPLLNEGIRAQFALRLIASRCASYGYDVLRFDFAGLGNSLGRPEDFSLDRWQRDIITAAGELEDISGAEVKTAICVRFAANLAASASHSMRLDHLLLWDPVLTGNDWLKELLEARASLPKLLQGFPSISEEYSGHVVCPAFVTDLGERDLDEFKANSIVAVISADYRQEDRLRQLVTAIAAAESDCQWRTGSSEVMYPGAVIESICSQLA